MKLNNIHPWNITQTQAIAIQKSLSSWIIQDEQIAEPISIIARAQLLYDLDDEYSTATVTLYETGSFEILERHSATMRLGFPPIEGLLSFRRAPVILNALAKLNTTPELIICDGRGVTGEQRFGLASHVGLISNLPTIGWCTAPDSGVAQYMKRNRGNWIPTGNVDQPLGALLRIHPDLPPIYISHAHRVSLKQALRCSLLAIPTDIDDEEILELLPSHSIQAKLYHSGQDHPWPDQINQTV